MSAYGASRRRLSGLVRWRGSLRVVCRPAAAGCIALCCALWSQPCLAQPAERAADEEGRPPGNNPDDARLVTSDITNFWLAYDKTMPEDRVAVFRDDYLGKGSYGLRAFTRSRIGSAEKLAATVEAHPKFFASIRESTLRITSMEQEIRTSFRKLKELYPEAVFPDVYFVVGRMSSGGTTSPRGLLIGVEMHGRTDQTPLEELGAWHRAVVRSADKIPSVVAHELIHCQQRYPLWNITLLRRAIEEGGADFLAELIAGSHGNPHLHEYGNAREQELWQEFRKEMYGFKGGNWLYQGDQSRDRPADLGYYIGYKICESYYRHAEDKSQAVKDILTISDFTAFLAASGYEQKFAAGEESDEWRPLPLIKDGKVHPDWVQIGYGGFVVEDGSLKTECDEKGLGLLLYRKEKFGNCQIRVVYRSQDARSNSGVFVRIDDGILSKTDEKHAPGRRDRSGRLTEESLEAFKDASREGLGPWYAVHHGYEIQISGSSDPSHRTGSVYSLAPAAAAPRKEPSEWKTMIITLDGHRVLVDIDGQRVTTFDADSKDVPPQKQWYEPRREPKRPTAGYIGLQNHDPGDVVYFKEVSVRSLENTKGSN